MNLRPLTNEVILSPVGEESQLSAGGIVLPNRYKKPTLKFRVEVVGPAGYVRRITPKGKIKLVYRQPEVEVGDMVLSTAILDSSVAKHHFDDNTGRVIVDADSLLMKWNSEK